MIPALKVTWELSREAVEAWVEDKGARLGAALAFYSVFAMGPLVIIAIAIASFFIGQDAATGEVHRQLQGMVGKADAEVIEAVVIGAQKQGSGVTATLASLGMLLVVATALIIQLKDALNSIWSVRPKPGRALRTFCKDYIVSLAALFALGFLLMASVAVSAGLASVGDFFGPTLPLPVFIVKALNSVVGFACVTLVFALIFKLLPDVRIRWRDVWLGAVATAGLFSFGRTGIGYYLQTQDLASTYGAAASLMAVLVWIYYFSQILFLGAEFTKVYTRRFGGRVVPGEDLDHVHTAVSVDVADAESGL